MAEPLARKLRDRHRVLVVHVPPAVAAAAAAAAATVAVAAAAVAVAAAAAAAAADGLVLHVAAAGQQLRRMRGVGASRTG